MFARKDDGALVAALDAAVVRLVERGGVEAIAARHPPYSALVVHSCKPSASHFDWPSLARLNRTVVRVAALGPYDWGATSGNYTAAPPYRGFWPDYYRAIEAEFDAQYGAGTVRLERVWYPTSGAVLASLADGHADTTEPYMMVGAAFEALSRKSAFAMSCVTSATQDTYFARPPPPPRAESLARGTRGADGNADARARVVTGLAVSGGALVALLTAGVAVLIRRERQNAPIFAKAKLLDGVSPGAFGPPGTGGGGNAGL